MAIKKDPYRKPPKKIGESDTRYQERLKKINAKKKAPKKKKPSKKV